MTPCRTGIVDLPHTRRIEAPRWPTAKADHRGHRRAAAGRHAARERRVGAAACGARMQEVLVAEERAAARTVTRQPGRQTGTTRCGGSESDHRESSAHSQPLGARASGPAASALGGQAQFEQSAGAPADNGGEWRVRAIFLGTAACSPTTLLVGATSPGAPIVSPSPFGPYRASVTQYCRSGLASPSPEGSPWSCQNVDCVGVASPALFGSTWYDTHTHTIMNAKTLGRESGRCIT